MTLRYGMVGGGPGALIGPVHRMAAALDGEFELVAGSFSSDPSKSAGLGRDLRLDPARVYDTFEQMAEREAGLDPDERIHVVTVVTPNHLHYGVAKAFLERDIHVICDKPLTTTLEDAEELCSLAAERSLVFAVTHNYTGYPMVKEARARARGGALGQIRKVVVEYSQGWLRELLEAQGHRQAEWRGDPERAGVSSALSDIGSHAHNLLRYVTGLEITRLFADLGTVVAGRRMEDDATVLLELEGGARGLLMASQIATGERNHLRLRVYGEAAGLEWSHDDPNRVRLLAPDGTETVLHSGGDGLCAAAEAATRLPGGHPEGFIEAFANLYREVARGVRASDPNGAYDFPTAQDGARGVHFILAAVESDRAGGWRDVTYVPPGATPSSPSAER